MVFVIRLKSFFVLTDTWELKHATRNISPTNNQANIVDLHPASVYSIRMFSYNAIGKSEASKELTISTEEARRFLKDTIFNIAFILFRIQFKIRFTRNGKTLRCYLMEINEIHSDFLSFVA